MKILFISNLVGLYSGGHTRNIYLLARDLKKLGNDVSFFVYKVIGDVPNEGITIHTSGQKKYSLRSFSKKAKEFVENSNYDIIHSNGAVGYYYFKKDNRIPTVFHARSHNLLNSFSMLMNKSTHKNFLYRISLGSAYEYFYDLNYIKSSSYVIANCNDVKNKIEKDVFNKTREVRVIRNAIISNNHVFNPSQELFNNEKTISRFGYFASFYPLKGWDYLIQIIKHSIKINPGFEFHIGGDGVLFDYFSKKIKKAGIENNTRLYGRIKSQEEKDQFFKNFDIFLVPAHCPTTVTEALGYYKLICHFGRWFDCAHGMDLEPFIELGWAKRYINKRPKTAAKILSSVALLKKPDNHLVLHNTLKQYYSFENAAFDCQRFYEEILGKNAT